MSREQPAKAIGILISLFTIAVVLFSLTPFYGPPEALGLLGTHTSLGVFAPIVGMFNLVASLGIPVWFLRAAQKHNIKHMERASFYLSLVYLLTTLSRLLLLAYPFQLLWVPFLVISMILGVCFLYFSTLRRDTDE
jgi:hypothetical protein